jgi:hypothetical protein
MNQFTIVLAALVIVTHLGVIFWPRKPLTEATDENGFPILWRNQNEQSKDVACIWRAEERPAGEANMAEQEEHLALSSVQR